MKSILQSKGVGDPKKMACGQWTSSQSGGCHTTRSFKYEVGIPVLKGAGDNVLPIRGM